MERRNFLKTTSVFAAGLYASQLPVIAGPFMPGESGGYQIPVDKKLDPAWVKSLRLRGKPTHYSSRRNELTFIGMPVGGMHTGTLYLGGDGRLWLWDVFNDNREGINPLDIDWDAGLRGGKKVTARNGSAYVVPARENGVVDQGFAFRIKSGDKTVTKRMIASDWEEIVFEATYPMATITYVDKNLPVQIVADVFTPFIPLDETNSGLPATIYSFRIHNTSKKDVEVQIAGWLENKTCISSQSADFERVNSSQGGSADMLFCSIQSKSGDSGLGRLSDYGSMGIAALTGKSHVNTKVDTSQTDSLFGNGNAGESREPLTRKLTGDVVTVVELKPTQTAVADFVISWHFPNLSLKEIPDKGRYYNALFASAKEVMEYVRQNHAKLSTESRLWKETFYDSTLPWWFLERTFLNISCLATTTSHRMENGRHYAWEGVGCCPGTCTHVWQYAQASGRIFPSMERDIRERIDLGLALQEDGSMWYRCEADKRPSVDGQAGTILRFYREHQMSEDNRFLTAHWPNIRKTVQYLMSLDRNGDGMEDTPVENTLDALWDGEISWIVGLCLAAVKAGELMAVEMNDPAFASLCRDYVAKGRKSMEEKLFNGEYFIHLPDAVSGRAKLGSYNTCHIDQVYGQSWAFQVGMGRILDKEKTVAALKSLWKYNFTPDVGPYIKDHPGGRPYALAGEGGLIMNSNPKNEPKPYGDNETWQLGYFHECMTGFEHQVASHMMAEGLVDESLVLTRMIHDRYHAAKRNPFNEIECSDHYARAMASYGTFLMACGFEYHGPKGYIKFAPKIGAENFKAPFVTAQGWGTYSQKQEGGKLKSMMEVKYGKLSVQTIGLETTLKPSKATITRPSVSGAVRFAIDGNQCRLELDKPLTLQKGEILEIEIS